MTGKKPRAPSSGAAMAPLLAVVALLAAPLHAQDREPLLVRSSTGLVPLDAVIAGAALEPARVRGEARDDGLAIVPPPGADRVATSGHGWTAFGQRDVEATVMPLASIVLRGTALRERLRDIRFDDGALASTRDGRIGEVGQAGFDPTGAFVVALDPAALPHADRLFTVGLVVEHGEAARLTFDFAHRTHHVFDLDGVLPPPVAGRLWPFALRIAHPDFPATGARLECEVFATANTIGLHRRAHHTTPGGPMVELVPRPHPARFEIVPTPDGWTLFAHVLSESFVSVLMREAESGYWAGVTYREGAGDPHVVLAPPLRTVLLLGEERLPHDAVLLRATADAPTLGRDGAVRTVALEAEVALAPDDEGRMTLLLPRAPSEILAPHPAIAIGRSHVAGVRGEFRGGGVLPADIAATSGIGADGPEHVLVFRGAADASVAIGFELPERFAHESLDDVALLHAAGPHGSVDVFTLSADADAATARWRIGTAIAAEDGAWILGTRFGGTARVHEAVLLGGAQHLPRDVTVTTRGGRVLCCRREGQVLHVERVDALVAREDGSDDEPRPEAAVRTWTLGRWSGIASAPTWASGALLPATATPLAPRDALVVLHGYDDGGARKSAPPIRW